MMNKKIFNHERHLPAQAGEPHELAVRYLSYGSCWFVWLVVKIIFISLVLSSCKSSPSQDQNAPLWVTNLERAYPSREWVAVTAQGNSQAQAESAAMNSLARAFRTDVQSITLASQQFSQIIDNSTGSRNIIFYESQQFSQDIQLTTAVRGLIGVQVDVYNDSRGTVYVCARMNRRECAGRYSAIINENTAIITTLLASANNRTGFEAYSRLSFAHALAQITDNFQQILEVLDSTAANRKPSYGGANAIRTRMIEVASLVTIGIVVNTEQSADKTLFTRAAGSFFRDLGFRVNESGQGNYVLRVNVRLETISQNVISCRYFLDAALENPNGVAIFSFTEDDRKAHHNTASEARRLAVRAAETSFKEGKFAQEFYSWLNSFVF